MELYKTNHTKHQKDFNEWVNRENIQLLDNVPESVGNLSVGHKCTFVNKYGVKFPGNTILGFCEPESGGKCVFLDKGTYWLPVSPDSLINE